MTTELYYLTLSALLAAFLWVPYILNVIVANPITDAVGYPEQPLRMAPWAERLKKAHYNAVENLVVFAALILIAHLLDAGNGMTEAAAMTYFWARVVHAVAYTAAIPWVRTLAFAVAWVAMILIGWVILHG